MTEREKVEEWNRRYPKGTTVQVLLEGGGVQVSTTRCEARLSGQIAVIWVRGISGAYPLDRVSALPSVDAAPPSPAPSAAPPAPTWLPSAAMRFEVVLDPATPDAWRVEAIDRNGSEQFYLAIFRGPSAEARAREYADWKNAATR
jgi:hypothetical protein